MFCFNLLKKIIGDCAWKKLLYYYRLNKYNLVTKYTKTQIQDPNTIPIIIINYNQLYYLKILINFLQKKGLKNIIVVDNNSTYIPLLKYYNQIKKEVIIERLNYNGGHKVFFENEQLLHKYGRGFYFLTDPDIIPNENLPKDFAKTLLEYLVRHFNRITKVGFSLNIKDIPDHFPYKKNVINWEKKFWNNEIEPSVYLTEIDTTFSLYKPYYPNQYNNIDFYKALRIGGGGFTAKHGGWYLDPDNLTEEQKYYLNTASKSASWNLNNIDKMYK